MIPAIPLLLAAQTTIVLNPSDAECIATGSLQNFHDNRVRAYWDNPAEGYVDGLLKFDLSSIPNKSGITFMSLRLYHEFDGVNPFGNPEVAIYRSLDDGWSSQTNDPHPVVNRRLCSPVTSFPVDDLVPVDIPLNHFHESWPEDLADNELTLIVRNLAGQVGRQSHVYFYGKDPLPAPPELTITYVPTPGISVANLRHNVVALFQVYNATVGANCAVVLSPSGSGPATINAGPCGPTSFSLSPPHILLGTDAADAMGVAIVTYSIPAGARGRQVWVQGIDVSDCEQTQTFFGIVE